MWGRRILYLLCLLAGLVFFGLYREWFSWLLLLLIIGLPWLSLLLSLPAMCTVKVSLRCPQQVQLHTPVRTALQVVCPLPAPQVKSKIHLHNLLSGERFVGRPGERVPTDRCGRMVLTWDEIYVYDYLCLFRRRLKDGQGCEIYIFPKPIKTPMPTAQSDGPVHAWRPKAGGGFSENRDLRLYRPGDNLRHIHWKLTAKVGKPIYSEPMEPVQQGNLLTVCLFGDLEEKLGRLLYVSRGLLGQNLPHRIRCGTADGALEFSVENGADLSAGFRQILQAKPASAEQKVSATGAVWHHHIGGGAQ